MRGTTAARETLIGTTAAPATAGQSLVRIFSATRPTVAGIDWTTGTRRKMTGSTGPAWPLATPETRRATGQTLIGISGKPVIRVTGMVDRGRDGRTVATTAGQALIGEAIPVVGLANNNHFHHS
jgi:hypothetical protein